MPKHMTQRTREQLACELVDYLAKREMFDSLIAIYVNGGVIYAESRDNAEARATPGANTPYWFTPNAACPCEYQNPDTLTVTFEGFLYHMLNEACDSETQNDLNKLFAKYGLYYEQGYAWSFALYEL